MEFMAASNLAQARHGVQVHPSLSLSSEVAITALVARGLGFALLPRLTIPPLPDRVIRHPLPWPVTRRYGTVTRSDPLSAAVLAALEVLMAG